MGGPRLAAHPSNAAFRRRFRLTTHEPLTGKRIGLTLWFGSVDAGWTGWPVFKRGMRWTIGGVDADDRSDAAATRVVRHRSFKRALRVGLLGPVYLGGALAIAAALPMVFFIAWLFDGDLREEWETWKQIAADVRSEVWDG